MAQEEGRQTVLPSQGLWRHATRGIVPGALVGLACLCRPTFQPWAALLVLSLLAGRGSWPLKLSRSAALLLGVSCVLLPWGLRNYQQFGEFRDAPAFPTHDPACAASWRLMHSNNVRRIRPSDWYTEFTGRPSSSAALLPLLPGV